jgi:N-methylhydantoinase B
MTAADIAAGASATDPQPQPGTQPPADAFTAEVIRAALVAITDEMKTNLMRTAYNMIIYEAEDFTVGLFDADGRTLSIGLGLPMFIRGLSDSIMAKIKFWGKDNIHPGDILLTNDPAIMGSHLNHMIFTAPIFNDGELVAFAATMAHWQDIGGQLGGMTRDLYTEGLLVPFVKIFKGGAQDPELTAMIRANVRNADLMMGDMRAQIAALRTGERRLSDLLGKYGNDAFRQCVDLLYAQSERLARAAVSEIPDGSYEAESYMDDDGVTVGRPIPIRVRITIDGDQMMVDLSGCSPQVAGFFNSGPTAGRSAAEVAFKFLTSPTLLPINDGSFRALRIVLPPGLIVSATSPAPVRQWMTVPMTVVDTIFKALAAACPDRVIAGHHADLALATLFGVDPAVGRNTVLRSSPGPNSGGWGATALGDGQSATVCINDGDTHNAPVEAIEAKAPIIVYRRELRPDSGGPGRNRGGLGVAQEIRMRIPGRVESRIERTKCAPWGLLGGSDGWPNAVSIVRHDGTVERFDSGKIPQTDVGIDEGYLIETGGGGGFYPAVERPSGQVLDDVRSGYVSAAAAARDYGVVIEDGDRGLQVNDEATRARREAIRREQG